MGLGKSWISVGDWHAWTAGCVTRPDGRTWFNTNPQGSANAADQPLCVVEEPAAIVASYAIGDLNTNTCPAGSVALADEASCQAAAKFLGKSWIGVGDWHAWTAGCVTRPDGRTWFNTNPQGSANAADQPLCVVKVAAAVAATYAIGHLNTNTCPVGSVAIADAASCQAAAERLGKSWISVG